MLTTALQLAATFLFLCLSRSCAEDSRTHAFIGYTEKEGQLGQVPGTGRIQISSTYGTFTIKLRPDLAPKHCELVLELAKKGVCSACKFYRHEPVAQNWGVNNTYGPPYALLQGSLADISAQPPFENPQGVSVKKGNICMIPNCKEFFIATADHPEWGQAHTVFGDVEDMSLEPSYPFEPCHSLTDGGITTRWLNNTFPFSISAVL